MKYGQKLKLGDAPCHRKKYPRSISVKAWGFPMAPLLHQQKYQVIFQDTIFLLLHMLCVFSWSVFIFAFSFIFILFAAINGWTPIYFFWRSHTLFSLPRTL
jgi:hypothetical protein